MKKQNELFGTEADIDNSKPLDAFHQCEGSPFILIKQNAKWEVVFGKHIVAPKGFDSIEEANEYIATKPWDLIILSATIYMDMLRGIRENEAENYEERKANLLKSTHNE